MEQNYIEELNGLSKIFKAFSDKNRLLIIWRLASKTNSDVSVNEIAQYLKISQPAASQHIKTLKNIGLLFPKKRGYFVYYKLDVQKFKYFKEKIDSMYLEAYKKC